MCLAAVQVIEADVSTRKGLQSFESKGLHPEHSFKEIPSFAAQAFNSFRDEAVILRRLVRL